MFTEAISFVVSGQTQHEVDVFWSRLAAGGQEVPTDREKARRVMAAMLKMTRIDIAALRAAYAGRW